ncbi:MAG: ceramidase domain-containing protein [Rickettsiales bacterium]
MSALLEPVDIYCERLAHGFWEEPLNALTNLAFIIAAIALYRLQKRTPTPSPEYGQNMLLIFLVALVGVGSFIFHTFANVAGLIADVGGIMIFVHTYLYFCFRRILGWRRLLAFISIGAFFMLLMAAENIPGAYSFNGSAAYFPCLAIIIWVWNVTRRIRPDISRYYLYAGSVFILSLTLRTIDMDVCDVIPMGTHIFWHICNGLVLYFLTKALIQPAKATN